MAYERTSRDWEHTFDYGTVRISLPLQMSTEDCNDLEAHFTLILRQVRRKASIQIKEEHPPCS